MKAPIILLCYLLIPFAMSAQDPDPDIFDQTWYLYEVHDTDTGDIFYVENYEPPISPYVIIDASYNFNGFGICNSFQGTLEYSSTNMGFRILTTSQTMNSCGFWGDQYEPKVIGPFGHFDPDPTWYSIINPVVTDDPDGFQTFTYITQPFINYKYRNTPILGVDEFKGQMLSLFPNPTHHLLIIESGNDPMESIVLYDATGKRITTISPASSRYELDTSSMSNGLYFIEISTVRTRQTRRIIKN